MWKRLTSKREICYECTNDVVSALVEGLRLGPFRLTTHSLYTLPI
jgi:hypothetical protein